MGKSFLTSPYFLVCIQISKWNFLSVIAANLQVDRTTTMVEVLYFNRVIALLQGCLTGYFAWSVETIVVDYLFAIDVEHTSIVRAEEERVDSVFRNVDVSLVCQTDDV